MNVRAIANTLFKKNKNSFTRPLTASARDGQYRASEYASKKLR
jgi:hypothetical protein